MGVVQPLRCHFGGLAVDITCADTAVYHILHQHCRYCLTTAIPPLAHYRLEQTSTKWQLHVDQSLLRQETTPFALFEPLLQDILQRLIAPQQQHLIFHAGSVSAAERGVLLYGQTGTGKSTLVAQLISAGFSYLTDEVVACPLETTHLSGFARSLVLKPGSEFLWQDAATHQDVLSLPDGFTWVAPTFFRSASVQLEAKASLLLFPHFEAGRELTIRPISAAESAFHLVQHLVNARNLPQHGLPAVLTLARNVPAYELHYDNGLAVAAWLQSQLSL